MAAKVLVCRGSSCGSNKHQRTDHAGQLAAVSAVAATRIVNCTNQCERSNVIVVAAADGTNVWLGDMVDQRDTDHLVEWLTDHAPMPLPVALAARRFEPVSDHVRRPSSVERALDNDLR